MTVIQMKEQLLKQPFKLTRLTVQQYNYSYLQKITVFQYIFTDALWPSVVCSALYYIARFNRFTRLIRSLLLGLEVRELGPYLEMPFQRSNYHTFKAIQGSML
jgi:hypothetical protein